jgi:hypothetical protein
MCCGRYRIEGYLPNDEFRAQLELGLARVAFMAKKWSDGERLYEDIVQRYPKTAAAPEAQYWAGVTHYKTNDHTARAKRLASSRRDIKTASGPRRHLSGHRSRQEQRLGTCLCGLLVGVRELEQSRLAPRRAEEG